MHRAWHVGGQAKRNIEAHSISRRPPHARVRRRGVTSSQPLSSCAMCTGARRERQLSLWRDRAAHRTPRERRPAVTKLKHLGVQGAHLPHRGQKCHAPPPSSYGNLPICGRCARTMRICSVRRSRGTLRSSGCSSTRPRCRSNISSAASAWCAHDDGSHIIMTRSAAAVDAHMLTAPMISNGAHPHRPSYFLKCRTCRASTSRRLTRR